MDKLFHRVLLWEFVTGIPLLWSSHGIQRALIVIHSQCILPIKCDVIHVERLLLAEAMSGVGIGVVPVTDPALHLLLMVSIISIVAILVSLFIVCRCNSPLHWNHAPHFCLFSPHPMISHTC